MKRAPFLRGALAGLVTPALPLHAVAQDVRAQLAAIERSTHGRLGVFAREVRTGRTIRYRARERFAMCSTFKLLLVSAILAKVERKQESLARRVPYGTRDLLEYAPITREHVAQGSMTVADLCAAAIEYSDNTAANLLLREAGGPHAVTRYARSLGDAYTILSRTEPALNTAIPGDVRDTTTPQAFGDDVGAIMSGALSAATRSMLHRWMLDCKTGATLLRAGVPSSWRVGDKTGMGGAHNASGDSDTRNDVAYIESPQGPVIIAAYLMRSQVDAKRRDAAIARVGRLVAGAFETA